MAEPEGHARSSADQMKVVAILSRHGRAQRDREQHGNTNSVVRRERVNKRGDCNGRTSHGGAMISNAAAATHEHGRAARRQSSGRPCNGQCTASGSASYQHDYHSISRSVNEWSDEVECLVGFRNGREARHR